MNNPTLSLLGISILGLLIIGALVYNNRLSDDILSISLKSFVVPLLIGVTLTGLEFAKPVEKKHTKVHLGLTSPALMLDISRGLRMTSNAIAAEATQNMLMDVGRNNMGDSNLNSEQATLYAEFVILNELCKNYGYNLDSKYQHTENFLGGIGAQTVKLGIPTNDKGKTITIKELLGTNKNPFCDQIITNKIYIPSNCQLKLEHNSSSVSISLISTKAITSIDLQFSSGSHVPGRPFNMKSLPRDMKILYVLTYAQYLQRDYVNFYDFSLEFTSYPKKLWKGNPEAITQQMWLENIAKRFEEAYVWEDWMESLKELQIEK